MICLNVIDENEGGQHLTHYNEKKKFTNHGLIDAFNVLKKIPVPIKLSESLVNSLSPCPPAKYQVMEVTDSCSIKEFVENNGIKFCLGFSFYEFNKPEIIADDKMLVLRNKLTGETFEGEASRQIMGIKTGLPKNR